jgi:hypothetical protein
MSDKFWDKMDEYQERFDDQFPLMAFRGVDMAEIEKMLDECLANGKPYEYDAEVFR